MSREDRRQQYQLQHAPALAATQLAIPSLEWNVKKCREVARGAVEFAGWIFDMVHEEDTGKGGGR